MVEIAAAVFLIIIALRVLFALCLGVQYAFYRLEHCGNYRPAKPPPPYQPPAPGYSGDPFMDAIHHRMEKLFGDAPWTF